VPCAQRARPIDGARVEPAPSGDLIADAIARAAQIRQDRRAWTAMEINREIVAAAPQPADQRDVGGPPTARRDDDLRQMRIAGDDRGGARFDEIVEARIREAIAQCANGRGREDDVPDLAKADEQDLQGSTVASSMSITGMSSLIGYTR
jgi:hypothetical protein